MRKHNSFEKNCEIDKLLYRQMDFSQVFFSVRQDPDMYIVQISSPDITKWLTYTNYAKLNSRWSFLAIC